MSKNTVDIDYAEKSVPQSERRSLTTMFMIMLGFTFFSASMWVGQELADGLDFSCFVISLILGGIILGMVGFLILAMLPVGIITSRILWKKGIIKVVDKAELNK